MERLMPCKAKEDQMMAWGNLLNRACPKCAKNLILNPNAGWGCVGEHCEFFITTRRYVDVCDEIADKIGLE